MKNFLEVLFDSNLKITISNSEIFKAMPGFKEETLTLYLTLQLIQGIPQALSIRAEQPQPGSEEEETYDPEANDIFVEFMDVSC